MSTGNSGAKFLYLCFYVDWILLTHFRTYKRSIFTRASSARLSVLVEFPNIVDSRWIKVLLLAEISVTENFISNSLTLVDLSHFTIDFSWHFRKTRSYFLGICWKLTVTNPPCWFDGTPMSQMKKKQEFSTSKCDSQAVKLSRTLKKRTIYLGHLSIHVQPNTIDFKVNERKCIRGRNRKLVFSRLF